ncbi:site-specific integrase [Thalassotalea litorea]|uniref:Site-specific integrase n=1 Tax=Thalassotalea litorea TaxID=2020715 RepID=A0A5R9IZK4_9GAMM|nr:site-specific integrase [Thalassotalea litorea]TLU67338.1 site-specific integrase [Thalassotalea litorea]
MATVRTRKGKRETTYKVEFMRNGKRVAKSFKKKTDAERYCARITLDNDFADGLTNYCLTSLTLSDSIQTFLNQYQKKDPCVITRLNWWAKQIGHMPLGKITKLLVKNTLAILLDSGKSPATYNRYKANLSTLFEFIKDEYDLDVNPARQVKQLAESKPKDEYLSKAELERLLSAAKASKWDRLYLLVLMAVSTGCRRSELINLQWSNIDFKNATAYLNDTKNGDRRIVPLTTTIINELKLVRQVGGFIFQHPRKNQPFRNFDCHWYQLLKDSNVSIRFHGLRHTTGSWLAMENTPLKAIAEILGHKTIQTTQRYVHHSTEHKAQEINRVFAGVGNG